MEGTLPLKNSKGVKKHSGYSCSFVTVLPGKEMIPVVSTHFPKVLIYFCYHPNKPHQTVTREPSHQAQKRTFSKDEV